MCGPDNPAKQSLNTGNGGLRTEDLAESRNNFLRGRVQVQCWITRPTAVVGSANTLLDSLPNAP